MYAHTRMHNGLASPCIVLRVNFGSFITVFGDSSFIIQIYPGITSGRVLNGELYAQRLQKLMYLYLSTDCFMKISLQ